MCLGVSLKVIFLDKGRRHSKNTLVEHTEGRKSEIWCIYKFYVSLECTNEGI